MVAHTKYEVFTEDLIEGVHDFDAHAFKIMLSNAAITTTHALRANVSELSTSGGYTSGGNSTTISTSRTSGTTKVIGTDPTAWTGSSGGFTGRSASLYNDNTAALVDPLVCGWDYGSSVVVLAGETFTVDLDGTNGMFNLV